MNFDERLSHAVDAVHRSVRQVPVSPDRLRFRRRRWRRRAAMLLAVALMATVAFLAFDGMQDESEVATRGQSPPTSPAEPGALSGASECPPTSPPGEDDNRYTTVNVFFFCSPGPAEPRTAVPRKVTRDKPPLQAALEELLRGPTHRERQAGLVSVFDSFDSPDFSAGDLLVRTSVIDGVATIDFSKELSRRNVGGGTGFTGNFFRQLDPTVFQFPEIQAVIYRIEGDAEAFCDMFEITCEPVTRTEAAKR